MDCDWFPAYVTLDRFQFEWYFETAPLPDSEEQTEYLTLFIKYWEADSIPGDRGTLHSLYYDGAAVLERATEENLVYPQ